MKNKHLVLLFLAVVLSGLFIRWLPVRYRPFFHSALIQVDTASITGLALLQPGQPELQLDRTESGWAVEQNGRISAVKPGEMTPLLTVLAGLHSLRTVKTKRADTLGFTGNHQIDVRVFRADRLIESFSLGRSVSETGHSATYLQLPLHEGVYLVEGPIRNLFERSIDDFRDKTAISTPLETTSRIELHQKGGDTPVVFEKNDSTNRWGTPDQTILLPADSVSQWLAAFQRLNGTPFADYFDESQALTTRIATIYLVASDHAPLTLQLFYVKPPEVPEDLSDLRRRHLHSLPAYVLHSSDNPMNYFAVADSNLVQFLCFGLQNKTSGQ